MNFFEACRLAAKNKRHVTNGYFELSYEDLLECYKMEAIGESGISIFYDPTYEISKYNKHFLENIEEGWEE